MPPWGVERRLGVGVPGSWSPGLSISIQYSRFSIQYSVISIRSMFLDRRWFSRRSSMDRVALIIAHSTLQKKTYSVNVCLYGRHDLLRSTIDLEHRPI